MKVWDTLMEEYLRIFGISKDTLKEIIHDIMSDKYVRLEIELRHPTSYHTIFPYVDRQTTK